MPEKRQTRLLKIAGHSINLNRKCVCLKARLKHPIENVVMSSRLEPAYSWIVVEFHLRKMAEERPEGNRIRVHGLRNR